MPCQSVTANYSLTYALGGSVFPTSTYDRILGMDSTIGLGSESSTLNFTIAGEPGDNSYGIQARANVGQAVIFTCNSFTFGGVLKSVISTEGPEGYTTKVSLTCPKDLLAKYDLFLNKSACSYDKVSSYPNLKVRIARNINGRNVHADIEEFSIAPQEHCKVFVRGIANRLPYKGDCSKYGAASEGKVARGATTYVSIIKNSLIKYGTGIWTPGKWQKINVNYSPLLWLANQVPYASTTATKMTLLDLVNAICDEAGYDFHCTLNGNWINFSFINKRTETVFGSVQNQIDQAKQNNKCIASSIGAESKNVKTNRVVTGSHIQYIKELYTPGNAHASLVLGFDETNPIVADNPGFNVAYPTHRLRSALSIAGFNFYDYHMLSEAELIACGTIDTWKLFGLENPNSLSRSCMNACGLDIRPGINLIKKYGPVHYVARAAVEAVKTLADKGTYSAAYEELCWPFFKSIYDTYYGKYYMVTLQGQYSATCYQDPTGFVGRTGVFLGEGGAATLMDTPVDSGWPDSEDSVIGTSMLYPFFDNSGKLKCFIGLSQNQSYSRGGRVGYLDLSEYGGDFHYDNGYYYTLCDVDGRAYNRNGAMGILVKAQSMLQQKIGIESTVNNQGLRAISLCYGTNVYGGGYNGTTDTSYVNIFKENKAAGGFEKIALPMKNNQITYGPWTAGNLSFTGGGVDVQVREDLNPWAYGGYQNMNTAGARLANDGLPWRTRYESGYVTIAESPTRKLGSEFDGGPILASIVVKFDKSGATTTYNYETYKPKFGNYAENLNDYMKKNVSDRRDNFNILREIQLETIRNASNALKTTAVFRSNFGLSTGPTGASSASTAQIIISSFPDTFRGQDDGCKIETGLIKAYDSDIWQDSKDYLKYAAVGMDMLYSPVSINNYNNHMANMQTKQTQFNYSIPSMPPFYLRGRLQTGTKIGNMQLNPYTTKSMVNSYFQGKGNSYGVQIDYLSFNDKPQNLLDIDNLKQNFNNLRTVAQRGPLLLHSWGYDTTGKPVPNSNPEKPGGTFDNNWLSNPKKWPVGPIDLRWDHNRGVWVSPQQDRLVVAQLINDLSLGGTADAALIVSALYEGVIDDDGNPINIASQVLSCSQLSDASRYATIKIIDVIGRPANKGSRVVAYHVGNGLYIPLMIADTYKKGPSSSCCSKPSNGPAHPCYSNEDSECDKIGLVELGDISPLMVEGIDRSGMKVLHNLISAFVSPSIYEDPGNGQTKVLAYTKKNSYGFPCMTGVPIVDCSGEPPGDDDPPVGDCDCPPPQVCSQGRCIGF
jgi:hypothetical protein